ncbi:MAG: precorrin-8X methylmutase [Oscillospiraceae bacterium]|nr:precorrin-8X methylmutase [Oscillospiraceae bacterium]
MIEEKLKHKNMPENQKLILKRVIHTTADFDYIENLKFSEHAVEIALQALKNGASIITDTNMALAGIHKKSLHALGGKAYCFMADSDVAEQAKTRGITRAMASMEKACNLKGDLIFAIGNAPTALYQLIDLIQEKKINPKLIIAVPVGFVNVIESKNLIMQKNINSIVAQGNKGGSSVAVAICNALLYQICRMA